MTNLKTLINKAKTNKSQESKTTLKDNGLTFVLKFAPNAQGYNGQFEGNTFYAYIGFSKDDMELVGDVYVKDNGVIAMWSDKQAAYTEGLKEIIDIERLHFGDAIAADEEETEEEEGAEVAPQPQSNDFDSETVRELLKEMHSLNKKIEVAEFNGRGSKGNQKKRDKVIREIANSIGVDADELVQELSY